MKFSPPIPPCSTENFYFQLGDYSFGFQAQEHDKEMWGGSVTYKYRVEDPRLGRFFAVDPLYAEYPWNSNYAFSENRLIDSHELEGLEAEKCNTPFNGGEKISMGWSIKLRLFKVKETTEIFAAEKIHFNAKRWNTSLKVVLKNVGDIVAVFKTATISDRLIINGPQRETIDSGQISTNPGSKNPAKTKDDPGHTYKSDGTGETTIQVIPNPEVPQQSFIGRLLNRNNGGTNTVYEVDITIQSQRKLTYRRIYFLGIGITRKKIIEDTQIEGTNTEEGKSESKIYGSDKAHTLRSAKKLLLTK